jgi:hypothetical protein
MHAIFRLLAVLLAVGVLASFAAAQYPYCPGPTIPQAPDACGPGFYLPNSCGTMWGPIHCVQPPWPPFNGPMPVPPCVCGGGPTLAFPSHAFARSPRDYFMIGD